MISSLRVSFFGEIRVFSIFLTFVFDNNGVGANISVVEICSQKL